METEEAIKNRRSIRRFRNKEVPEEELKKALEAVRWAPSWANTQVWEVIVIEDDQLKERLRLTLSQSNPANKGIKEAPLLIVFCGKKGRSGYYKKEQATDKGDWLMFDLGLAMENFMLEAHNRGLGTVCVGLFDHRKAKDILNIPQDHEVVTMTPLGYPLEQSNPPPRRSLDEFVFKNGWGEKRP